MLGGAWLLITAVLFLAAIILRQVPLLLVASLFLLTSGVARLWARYALERLTLTRRLSASRAFFGDTVVLEMGVANRKLLPLPWLEVRDEVPEELTFLKGDIRPSESPARALLTNALSLGWYRRLRRRFPIHCLKRGYFTFGPATVRSGDPFGFFFRQSTFEGRNGLIVYPRIIPLERLGIPSRDPFGELRVRRHLFEDPIRAMGTRDYVASDPLKRIHWKASARLRRLQSKVFDPSTTVDMVLFLDARTDEPPGWGIVERSLETAAIAAASIASYAVENGYRVGLCINEPRHGASHTVRIAPSDHPQQLLRILEALAMLQGMPFLPVDELLSSEGRSLPWGSTMVVITAVPTEPLLSTLRGFRRAGRRVALVLVGRGPAGSAYGYPVFHVPDAARWREMESLRLVEYGGGRRTGVTGLAGQPVQSGGGGDAD